MKTSYSDIQETEKYLHGDLSPQAALLFEAKLLLNEDLRMNTSLQRIVYRLVTLYHRGKLRSEVEAIHQRYMKDPDNRSYVDSVLKLFKS